VVFALVEEAFSADGSMNEATIVFAFVAPLGKATAWKSSESSAFALIPAASATCVATPRAMRAISAGPSAAASARRRACRSTRGARA